MKRAVWMGVVISKHLVTQFMTSQCSCRRLLFSASMPSCACKATQERIWDDWGQPSVNRTNVPSYARPQTAAEAHRHVTELLGIILP